jgi:hypothetical protein
MLKVVLAAALAGAVLGGCSKETTPAAERPADPAAQKTPTEVTPAAVPATEGEAPSGLAKARFDEANFDLKMQPKGAYKAGQAATLEVVLDAKKPFHVNDKYPYKLKLAKTEGVKFPSDIVKKDAVKLEAQRAVMTVAFTPEAAGKKKIGGLFSFSVCTDDKCLIEKRDLALEVNVD